MLKYNLRFERVATTFKNYDVENLSPNVDLRPKCPPIQNQLSIGSCTAHVLATAFQFNDPTFFGSRLYLYYNERFLDGGDVTIDDGSTLSQGVNALKKYGICNESLWPYVDDGARYKIKPPPECYIDGELHQVLEANNIDHNLDSMKKCLAHGRPFVLGIMIYSSFESPQIAKTGIIPMPNKESDLFLGGHAVTCVGYDDTKRLFIMRNSWGTGWGDKGYFYLPYEYLTDPSLSTDLWEIVSVETVEELPKPKPPKPAPKPVPIAPRTGNRSVPKPAPKPIPTPKPIPKSNFKPAPAPKRVIEQVDNTRTTKHIFNARNNAYTGRHINKYNINHTQILARNKVQITRPYTSNPVINNIVHKENIMAPVNKINNVSTSAAGMRQKLQVYSNIAQKSRQQVQHAPVPAVTRTIMTKAKVIATAAANCTSCKGARGFTYAPNVAKPTMPNTGPTYVNIQRIGSSLAKFNNRKSLHHQKR
jgi:hypothetical protein